jgi:hypothetical protein
MYVLAGLLKKKEEKETYRTSTTQDKGYLL